MDIQWEEFTVGPKDRTRDLHVTMDRKGAIMIGVAAFEGLGKPEAAVLLYDKANSLIGILPGHPRAANAYPLKKKSRCKHRMLRANRFCRHHNIRVDRIVAFNNARIDEGVLILNLRSTTAIGKRTRPLNTVI